MGIDEKISNLCIFVCFIESVFQWFIVSLNINCFPKPKSESQFRIFNFQLYIDIWKLNFWNGVQGKSQSSLNQELFKLNIDESYSWVTSLTMKFLKNMSLKSTQKVLFLFLCVRLNADSYRVKLDGPRIKIPVYDRPFSLPHIGRPQI